jgi:putative hydrolases of HD superfamily
MEIKSIHPGEVLNPPSAILRVLAEFNHLKNLYRQGWLKRSVPREKCESVADHSFSVTLLAMFLAENIFPRADLLKVIRIALIHEAGEIHAGDITPVDGVSPEEKHRREKESVFKVFAGVSRAGEYIELWEEFELNRSREAKIVRQADRLEMLLQAKYYERLGYWNFDEFFRNAEALIKSPDLRPLFEELQAL